MSLAKVRALRALLIAVCLASPGCNGPFLLLPGGALSGEPGEAPPEWSFAGSAGTAQLETRSPEGQERYSVNIAYTVIDGALYINAGDTETRWVQNIARDPNVRLRIDGTLYETRADRVTDIAALAAFGAAWTNQSFLRRDPRELDRVWLYRIVAR